MLVPADLEWAVRDWVRGQVAGMDNPPYVDNRLTERDRQVVIFSTGGNVRSLVSSDVRLVFDVYERTPGEAQRLAAHVFAAVRDLDCRRIGDVQFYDVSPEQPPFNYPHPEKPTLYRYQFNALVHARHVQGDI